MPTEPDVPDFVPASDLRALEPEPALERLCELYEQARAELVDRFEAYAAGEPLPESRAVYPYVYARIEAEYAIQTNQLVLGRVDAASHHGSTVTTPELFAGYLREQLAMLKERYRATIHVGRSTTAIPLTFALEQASASLTPEQRAQLQSHFHLPNLVDIHDDVVDGRRILGREQPLPLALFDAPRVDYSLHRLRHYTATSPESFQRFVMFTNYQRYVDAFVAYGREQVAAGTYEALVDPGDRTPQMPAYHLTRADKSGVTLVNIGVGPSNAKTMTDHLAVLRPHTWVMVGHCAGLRRTQRLGDYVLAHAYLRDDHVLDQALPPAIPLPTIAEVQVALTRSVQEITGMAGASMKKHLRTGTVVTTDDRNWELRFHEMAERFNQARAIAIDMESATIAANGYRYRVPYGTLLCVSDRPLHGEIKLPGMADAFYQERVAQHFRVGMRALECLRSEAEAGTLHSRKLRSFDEPLFR